MSEENVALVRRNYEVINSIDRSGEEFVDPEVAAPDLWAGLAPDFEISGRSDVPDARTYRGREESKEFWRMLQEIFTELRWEPIELTDLGDVVVAETRLVARGRGSDLLVESDETDVFWFRDGQIVRVQGFPTKAEALDGRSRRLSRLSASASRPGLRLAEHPPHQLQRPALVEGLVEVAALRALHAGGAAVVAGALADQPLGVAEQALELLVAAPGDPDPAGVAVVDEDRRRPVWKWTLVERPPMSQRSHIAISGSTAIWPCSVACRAPSRTSLGSAAAMPVREHVPERLGDEVLLGQLERDDVDHLVVAETLALVGDHLLGDRDRRRS